MGPDLSFVGTSDRSLRKGRATASTLKSHLIRSINASQQAFGGVGGGAFQCIYSTVLGLLAKSCFYFIPTTNDLKWPGRKI